MFAVSQLVRFIAVLLVCLVACVDTPPMAEPVVEQSGALVFDLPATPRAQTDLLIVVDDTLAMAPYRERLASLPDRLAKRFEWYTQRWIDLRVAVATNDGRVRRLPDVTEPWLAQAYDFNYTSRTNFTGTLAENLRALMDVGSASAGTSMPLEAGRRALESTTSLLREQSGLMILNVTASDDASPAPVADYVAWLQRAVSNDTWARDYLISGIYPTGSPRLDEYYHSMGRSIITPIEGDAYEEAVPWFPGDWLGQTTCLEDIDLDPATSEIEHECAMLALVDDTWRTIPECTPADRIERTEVESARSLPEPACWWMRSASWDCGSTNALRLELSGYTRTQHPRLRFDCRTR